MSHLEMAKKALVWLEQSESEQHVKGLLKRAQVEALLSIAESLEIIAKTKSEEYCEGCGDPTE